MLSLLHTVKKRYSHWNILFCCSLFVELVGGCNLILWSWWESSSTQSLLPSIATKRTHTWVRLLMFVELVGVEPTSAQGNHTLSTRLFQPSFFEHQQDLDHQLKPYPLKFHPTAEASIRLFPICLRRLTKKIRNNIP